ncbi:hypothetical protein U6R98_12210 [Cutibacterium acnes]
MDIQLSFEHDLFGKPVPTFPDHARESSNARGVAAGIVVVFRQRA